MHQPGMTCTTNADCMQGQICQQGMCAEQPAGSAGEEELIAFLIEGRPMNLGHGYHLIDHTNRHLRSSVQQTFPCGCTGR
jgi:hypothetical protein